MPSSVFCVLFPCIVNSHFSNLLIERSQAVPRKKEIAFPQDISPDLFVDTTVEQIVLFYRVLGDDWKLSVLFISTSPLCFGHKAPRHTALKQPPSPAAGTVCLLNFYLLLIVDFVFQKVLRGGICSVCMYKSAFKRVAPYLEFPRGQEVTGWEEKLM